MFWSCQQKRAPRTTQPTVAGASHTSLCDHRMPWCFMGERSVLMLWWKAASTVPVCMFFIGWDSSVNRGVEHLVDWSWITTLQFTVAQKVDQLDTWVIYIQICINENVWITFSWHSFLNVQKDHYCDWNVTEFKFSDDILHVCKIYAVKSSILQHNIHVFHSGRVVKNHVFVSSELETRWLLSVTFLILNINNFTD